MFSLLEWPLLSYLPDQLLHTKWRNEWAKQLMLWNYFPYFESYVLSEWPKQCAGVCLDASVVSDSLWPLDCSLPGDDAGVGCHFLLQGTFPTQGLTLHPLWLLHLAGAFFTTEPPRKPNNSTYKLIIVHYSLGFHAFDWSVHIFCVSLVQFWIVILF